MKKLMTILAVLAATVSITSCHDDVPVPDMEEAERTVIIYIMAENSLASYASDDIREMVAAAGEIKKNTNFIIYLDDRNTPVIYNLTAKKGLTTWYAYPEDRISTDSITMLSTLQKIVTAFPAKTYSLTLWSHGTGWVPQSRSIGVDNGENSFSNSGLQMDVATLRGVLEHLPHMEMVFFDACLMQSIEVAYELKDVTDYMVGSPTEIPGYGAPYQRIMPYLVRGDAAGLARTYYEYYIDGMGAALGVVDCRQLDAFTQVMSILVPQIWGGRNEIDTRGIQYYSPFYYGSSYRPEPFDIEGVMYRQLDEAGFALWKQAWDRVDVCHAATPEWTSVYGSDDYCRLTDAEHYSGMSMFVPAEKYAPYQWMEKFKKFRWYRAAGWDQTGW